MKIFCNLLLLTVLLNVTVVYGQLPEVVRNHIDSSLLILKNHSLYSNKVDWSKVEKSVYEKARSAATPGETFVALKIAFDALDDKHAAYYQFEDEYRVENNELLNRYSDSIKAAWSKGPRIHTEIIDGIAYISIPFLRAGKQEDIDKYANWIYNEIAKLNQKNPSGWIIDLRLNGGGNIRPMLGGLSAFFDDGIVSYYIDKDGQATDEAAFKEGSFTIDGVVQASIDKKINPLRSTKVAVLIGPGTASSGEGVAVVFAQRPETKLFGEQTAGLANSTNGFVFNNEESYFLISTAYIGDKNKKALPEFVLPDVEVKGNDAFYDLPNDKVVQSAIDWLKEE